MAGGRALRPTTIGRKAWLAGARNARAAPNRAATANRPHSGGFPCRAMARNDPAQAASTSTGIPLTHRDHATAVTYVTGHGRADGPAGPPGELDPQAPEVDWAALARPHQTLVPLSHAMGLAVDESFTKSQEADVAARCLGLDSVVLI